MHGLELYINQQTTFWRLLKCSATSDASWQHGR